MKYRFTQKQLKEMTDNQLLLALITERLSELSNVYSPLSVRLKELKSSIEKRKP